MSDMFERLAAPFPPERVSWRVGSTTADKSKGMALAYIDARDVMERLDDVCGPDGWERRHPHVNATTTCEIAIWIEGRGWIVKSDGAGSTDVEAEKGSLSDAFKRAAVNWGVGRYLYDLPAPWVELEPAGRSVRIKEAEHKKLEGLLAKFTSDYEWGSPESRATLRVLAGTIKGCVHTEDDVRVWREANAGVMAQMRVKARGHIDELLERIVETHRAKADDFRPGSVPQGNAGGLANGAGAVA